MAAPGIQQSALDIIKSAMRLNGVLAAGENPSADEGNDALNVLNQMLESWNTDRLNIFTISIAAYPLTNLQQTYTIGGPGLGANFDAVRPIRIEEANIILTNVTPNVRYPLHLLTDQEWSDIRVQAIPTTLPSKLYADGNFPLQTLYFWGMPGASLQLELFTWQALSLFADLATRYSFPPGYQRALRYNLAVELAPEYQKQIDAGVAMVAQQSKAAIQSQNTPEVLMQVDQALLPTNRRGLFNYFTG